MFADALFGHVRGAFTGALTSRTGYFVEANHGTVFLDEIGTLQPESQTVLLRAIEQKEFGPMGSSRNVKSDFRVVAATNENLEQLVQGGRFRSDLLYRLKGAVLRVPRLASRIEDIPELARHFLRRETRWHGAAHCTDSALYTLQQYQWPGNVRELQQVLTCAAAFSRSPSLSDQEIGAALEANMEVTVPELSPTSVMPFRPTAERLLRMMRAAGGDTAEVARTLGVSRKTVYRWMGQLGIPTPQRRREGAP
jgi:DNA-binding NtrC family response regulator